MNIVAALFVESLDLRATFEGGPTLIDLTGVHFSAVPPSPPPVTIAPTIGLYFGDHAPSRTPTMIRLGRQNLDVPADAPPGAVIAAIDSDEDVILYGEAATFYAEALEGQTTVE